MHRFIILHLFRKIHPIDKHDLNINQDTNKSK